MASPMLHYCVVSSHIATVICFYVAFTISTTSVQLFQPHFSALDLVVSELSPSYSIIVGVWAMSSQRENLSDIEPNLVVNLPIPNLECNLPFGLVEIRTQPLSYSIIIGIWALSSSRRKTFLICNQNRLCIRTHHTVLSYLEAFKRCRPKRKSS
jgi:ABC-type phosphate transport system permease subunit